MFINFQHHKVSPLGPSFRF